MPEKMDAISMLEEDHKNVKKLFPRAKKDPGIERLREIGERMEQRKMELQAGGERHRSAA